jgi:hypothetical protein
MQRLRPLWTSRSLPPPPFSPPSAMRLALVLLLAFATPFRCADAAIGSAAPAESSCVVAVGARTFDLGALGAAPLRFTSRDVGSLGWVYSFSACGDIKAPRPTCGAAAPRSAVLQQTDNACYGLGAFATRSYTATTSSLMISFSGGDPCGAEGIPRSTAVTIQCADLALPQVVHVGHGTTHCSYTALVRSRAGCALECARNASGAVCSGAAHGRCMVVDKAAGLSRCVCGEGRTGASCADHVLPTNAASAKRATAPVGMLVLFVCGGLFFCMRVKACKFARQTSFRRAASAASLLFCLAALFSSFGGLPITPSPHLKDGRPRTGSRVASFADGFADGCVNVYVDFGSNVGIQVRKLFEPELYSGAPVLPFFDKHLGAAELRRRETCAIGFEINPSLTPRLIELQTAYTAQGWRTLFLTETGVGFNDTTMTFRSDGDAAHLWWTSKLVLGQGEKDGLQIPVMSIVRVIRSILQRRLPESVVQEGPHIVVKLDVEGREFELMQLLAYEGLLCDISFLYVELHEAAASAALPAFTALQNCSTEIYALDDETSYNSHFQLPIKEVE